MFRACWASWLSLALGASVAGHCVAQLPPRSVEQSKARAAGIRQLVGRHIVLFTDVPESPEIDRLPAIFDQAVPQWAEYFGVDKRKLANWRARGYLIADRRRFEALGLMPPAGNDQFVNGISIGTDLWLYDQPTDYYRRHLLLHEGTHVFMTSFLGGCGPGWYMEGTAELLGTHRLDEVDPPRNGSALNPTSITLRIMPSDRSKVPMLGRIKLIQDAVKEGRALDFPSVLKIDNREQLGNESYAWCWAAAKWLDSHPRYRDRFRRLQKQVTDPRFNEIFRRRYARDWQDLEREWRAFISTLDHGYDFERMAIDFRKGTPLSAARKITIAADGGWQSSGTLLEAGGLYRIQASGRFQIAAEEIAGEPQLWPCEPGGVTIEYHDGLPLGMLIGAVDADFDKPFAIGLSATITAPATGTLYLRVNDSAARLGDNQGELLVEVEAVRP